MVKSFKCNVCKETKTDAVRYQCYKHKIMCKNCVVKPWIGKPFCEPCKEPVMVYMFSPRNQRWEKEK